MAWKLAGKCRGKNISVGLYLESLFMFSDFAYTVTVKSFEATALLTSLASAILSTKGTSNPKRITSGGVNATGIQSLRAQSHA